MRQTSKPVLQQAQPPVTANFAHLKTETYTMPMPPPELVERYEAIVPGFAERFMQMAEREQKARLEMEVRLAEIEAESVRSLHRSTMRGQIFALIAVIVMCCFCGFLAYRGYGEAAASASKVIIVSLAATFLGFRAFFGRGEGKQAGSK